MNSVGFESGTGFSFTEVSIDEGFRKKMSIGQGKSFWFCSEIGFFYIDLVLETHDSSHSMTKANQLSETIVIESTEDNFEKVERKSKEPF